MFKTFRSHFIWLSGTLAILLGFLMVFCVGATIMASAAKASLPQRKGFTPAPSNTAMLTYKNDISHSGWNSHETILTPQKVNKQSFGLHGAYNVDGQIYGQPLYVPNLNGHNVVFVVTENDSLYAFDADGGGLIWQKSFLVNGAVIVTTSDVNCADLKPVIGITSTPVIDSATNTLYLVAFTKENGQLVYRLHALDLTNGQEKFGGPTILGASGFDPLFERQRANLLLSQGNIYIAFASFCDNDPYHGFVLSYSASTLQQSAVYNDTPNGSRAGIWGGQGTLTADANGNIYLTTGNGTFDLNTGGQDGGDSFIKLNPSLQLLDYFTPFNQHCLDAGDVDLGSGGVLILPGHQSELISAGKQGRIYVVDSSNMGHFVTVQNPCNKQTELLDTNVKQELSPGLGGLYSTPSTWISNNGEFIYLGGVASPLMAFQVNSDGTLVTTPTSQTSTIFAWPGSNTVVSSNAGSAGIVWAVDASGVLHAYDATNLATELYNTSQTKVRDGLDNYVKFAAPMVANGEVFVGTQDRLYIYGLLPLSDLGYNNVGISDDGSSASGNFDGNGFSYSAQALQNAGLVPAGSVVKSGFTFTWPNVQSGQVDNKIAFGQTIPLITRLGQNVLGILGAATNGNTSGTLTLNYADGTSATVTLGFTDWSVSTAAFSNQVAASLPYINGSAGQQTTPVYVYLAQIPIPAVKTLKSIILPRTVTGGIMHIFAFAAQRVLSNSVLFNNVGITNDSSTTAGAFDTSGNSYSFQALRAQNVNPGSSVVFNGVTFTWPNVPAGAIDNYAATGQVIPVNQGNNESILAFLGAATNGNTTGQGTINYTDNTTQPFTLNFSDWTLGGGNGSLAFGNGIVITMPYRNTKTGQQTIQTYVLYTAVALDNGKTVKSVTLPNNNYLHVFSIVAYSAATNTSYTNTGISDDAYASSANFDGLGDSYSAEALQVAGVTPNCLITFGGYTFTWPNEPSQAPDNYQLSNGLVLPVSTVASPTGLAFLGAATDGPTTVQVVVTHTDNTTETFTLTFSDWTLNAGTSGVDSSDQIAVQTTYLNSTSGRRTLNTYVFFTQIALTNTSGVQSVTFSNLSGLPDSTTHIFAISGK
jgi:hypothetical protein